MAENKKNNKEKYIIAVLAVVLIAVVVFFFFRKKTTNKPAQVLFEEYQELESAYSKALGDIDKLSEEEYSSIEDMRKELRSKVLELKSKKDKIDISHKESEELFSELAENLENFDKIKKDTIKGDGNVKFDDENNTGELVYSSEEVNKILGDNEELKKRNKQLEKNITTVKTYYEKEKANNAKLNAQVTEVNKKLEEIKSEGATNVEELKRLLEEKENFEKKLRSSDKTIEKQNSKINKLVVTLRKVNVNCSFIYEKGNPEKEMRVFLTKEGLSRVYLNYLKNEKPTVDFSFKLNPEMFQAGTEKISLKLYNSSNREIYATSKTVASADLTISVPAKVFDNGEHSVELKSGSENLIMGDSYKFNIGK